MDESILNCSTALMSREELQHEYEKLKSNLKLMQNDMEGKNQQIHNYKRELVRLEALEKDYIQEIESVQSSYKSDCKNYELKNHKLEEQNAELTEKVRSLKNDVSSKGKEIKELNESLNSHRDHVCATVDTNEEDIKVKELYIALKDELCMMADRIENLQFELENTQAQNVSLEDKLANINLDYERTKETLNFKKDELEKANQVIHDLQEELLLTKNDLEALKSKPLDQNTKGNSLFAEVDDRRVQLQNEITIMKKKYAEIKRDFTLRMKQVSTLNKENFNLNQYLADEMNKKNADHEKMMCYYKDRVHVLETMVVDYEKEITERQTFNSQQLSENVVQFVENMVDTKRKEVEKNRQELNRESRSNMILALQLKNANTELREWRAKASKLLCQVTELEVTIHQLKTQSPTIETVEDKTDDLEEQLNFASKSYQQKNISDKPTVPKQRSQLFVLSEQQINSHKPITFKLRSNLEDQEFLKVKDIVNLREEISPENEAEGSDKTSNLQKEFIFPHRDSIDFSRYTKRSSTNTGVDMVFKEEAIDESFGPIFEQHNKCDDKENLASELFLSKKKVMFSEDTVEPNQNRPRRRGRVLEYKTMFLPSFSSKK